MFSLIHDIRQCPNNNVSLEEAKSVLSMHTWKTARRIIDIIYQSKWHKFIEPESKAWDNLYGTPIHKLNEKLIRSSYSYRDIEKIKITDIPETDIFWLQEWETTINNDDSFDHDSLNDMYAFRLLKWWTPTTNTSTFQWSIQTS